MKLTDPTAVHDSIEVLNQDIVSLEPEVFEVKRITVPLEDCCLIYQHCSFAVRARTRIYKGFDSCTILGPHSHGSLDGSELLALALITAGRDKQVEIVVDSGYESIALLVAPGVLDKHLALRGTKKGFAMSCSPFFRQMIRVMGRLVRHISEKRLTVSTICLDEVDHLVRIGTCCVVIFW